MSKSLNNCLFTALITPFDHHRQIDLSSLAVLIERQQEAGNGILILGSTGEGLAIKEDDKKRIVDFVSAQNPDVAVMVGVGGHNIEAQLNWMSFCERHAVDAFLLVTPYYARPGFHGQLNWFSQLLDHSNKPCMLYNVPKRTGASLDSNVARHLSTHENFLGIKEASGSLEELKKFQAAAPDARIYCGSDLLTWDYCKEGCSGLVGVMSNIWPKATRRFVEECLKGMRSDIIDDALTSSQQANYQNPLAVKAALYKKRLISTPRNLPPLNSKDFDNIEELMDADARMEVYEKKVKVRV